MENLSVDILAQRIRAARGEIPADLVLKNGRVVNVFSGSVQACDVAMYDGVIVGLGSGYRGNEEIDLAGKWIAPGLIDAHIHVESSMLLPSRLGAALIPFGTTSAVCDPHEIANVLGLDGIRFMLEESRSIPFDFFFMAPSCVPATHLESSGANLSASDLMPLKDEPRVIGLAEVMNSPGVVAGNAQVLEKLVLFQDRVKDGHCPSLRGRDLQAYITAGIRSDHETGDPEEAAEKISSGMFLMIREGTSAKNLDDLIPLISERNERRACLVSDDLHPTDIVRRGHLDHVVRRSIRAGLDPVTALRLVTINPAEYFGLKDRGAVAAGYRADLVILDDLEAFSVDSVFKDGRRIVEQGRLIHFPSLAESNRRLGRIRFPPIGPDDFQVSDQGLPIRVIELIPGQITTKAGRARLTSMEGRLKADTEKDVLKLAVLERHQGTGRIGLGFVRGFGLKSGALGTSVAHDSHNLIAVGVDDRDLCAAFEALKEMGGGMVATDQGQVLAKLPLPIGGLMTDAPIERVTTMIEETNAQASALGCVVPDPYMALSFLALPVIPDLKLSDRGLVDVNRFEILPLYIDDRNPL